MESFVQDVSYAQHFGAYRKILSLLNHDAAMFGLERDARIADVGCGYGDTLRKLKSSGYNDLVGIEPDPHCRAGAVGLDIREGTLDATSLPSESVDAAIVNNVFHHVGNYADAIQELARILRPGGMLCFIEPRNTTLRAGMDFCTFHTPLRFIPPIQYRHRVMSLEMATGLYPKWLREQRAFHVALDRLFERIFLKSGLFFQFGKYRKKASR